MSDPNLFFNDIAYSDYGHYVAVGTATVGASLLVGGIATFCHYAAAKCTAKNHIVEQHNELRDCAF